MFHSLVSALEGSFDKPFESLPQSLQDRVTNDLPPPHWNRLSPEQRREGARQWDQRNDPALAEGWSYWFSHCVEMQNVDQRIEKWKTIPISNIEQLEKQENRLAELQRQRAAMAQQMDYSPATSLAKEETGNSTALRPTAKRNWELQCDANALAEQWQREGRRRILRRDIAKALAQSEKWKEMKAITIERILRVEWVCYPSRKNSS